MAGRRAHHWNRVYETRAETEVSWYTPHLETSLDLIDRCGLGPGAAVIDVGGGAATLVDDLLDLGFGDVTVLDISAAVLDTTRRRLGARAGKVRWIAGDVTEVALPANGFDLWHDRAVFHFLVDEDDRARYVAALRRALKPSGQVVLATFAPDGPERCSGLPVCRYAESDLLAAIGPGFRLDDGRRVTHWTPAGGEQRFTYVRLARDAG